MKTERTIVILSPGFPENEADSTCLPTQQLLASALHHLNGSVKVLTFQYPFTNQPYQWNGIDVIPFNGQNKNKLARLTTWIKVWRELKKLRKQEKFHMLSFWCTECALIGKWFAKMHKLKHLIWISGQDARKQNDFVRVIQPKTNELVAMSLFLKDQFEKNHGITPSHIIPNAIDPSIFPPLPSTRNIDIMAAGSLIPLKQYHILVDLASELIKHHPNLKIELYGKGELEDELRQLARGRNIEKNIYFGGEIDHGALLEKMQQAKLFIHPSSYEGLSSVCLEALYAGAHVISFCSPGGEPVDHWHIVHHQDEMCELALKLLQQSLNHNRVLYSSIDDTASGFIKLFNESNQSQL